MNAENATIVMLNLFQHLIKLMGYETLRQKDIGVRTSVDIE